MKAYIAHDKTSGLTKEGGLHACLHWGFSRVKKHPESVIAILKIRPGEDGHIIAEVDKTGGRWIFGGRYISKREVAKLARRAVYGCIFQ